MKKAHIIKHIEHEGLGLLENLLNNFDYQIYYYRTYFTESLPFPKKGDLVISLGGPMSLENVNSIYHPWMVKEIDLCKRILDEDIAFIGICLGAQILSYAAGGRIEPLSKSTYNKTDIEIGWKKIYANNPMSFHPLKKVISDEFYVLHWHSDRILLPRDAILLGKSEICAEQLFQISRKTFGIQFHAEIEDIEIYNWSILDNKFVKQALGKDAISILIEENKKYCLSSKNIRISFLSKLIEICENSQ